MYHFIGAGYDIPITNMFDIDGDETDDPSMAIKIVGLLPDGRWVACECQENEIVSRSREN